jgi:prevent-host-death family protein
MKKATVNAPPERSLRRPRRLGIAEAKSRLSELLREVDRGPTIIHSRGRDVAVVLAVEDYERLTAEHAGERTGGARFLDVVAGLKQRHGGGVDDFTPGHITFEPESPFARASRTRS